jgi:CelD/BcsL family acetyltransferase involved in cellulose biosynthesis
MPADPDRDSDEMNGATSSSCMSVSEVRDLRGLAGLADEWNAVLAATADEFFYRHEFITAWIESFAPRADLSVLIARDADGRLAAALPLVRERGRICGIPARQLVGAANAHSFRFDMIAREPGPAAEAFAGHLAADRSWDVLRLSDVPEHGNAWHLRDAVRRRGWPVGTWDSLASPFIPLPPDHAGMERRLTSKFRANCRRRRAKLIARGAVSFECFEGAATDAAEDALDRKLDEGLALEASGWKGERGTAIVQDAAAHRFYRTVARIAARRGELALYFLRLDDRAVAFQLGVIQGGRYLLLKPGYDEGLSECSPGQLLMEDVVRDCIGRKLVEVDFLGPDMTWKRDWTDRVRPHAWLYCFRDTLRGRTLHAAKFRWLPLAKRLAARGRA